MRIFLSAALCFGAIFASGAETIVFRGAEKGIDLSGSVAIADEAATGRHSYKVVRSEIAIHDLIRLEPGYRYRFSAAFKSANGKMCHVYLGVHPFDALGRPVGASYVSYRKNTLTRTARAAKKGDRQLHVRDASKWSKAGGVAAFFAEKDLCDIPNENISPRIAKITCGMDDDVIEFTAPLAFDVPAGTPVRQHNVGGPYHYVKHGTIKPGAWTTWRTEWLEAKDLRHAASIRLLMVVNAASPAKEGELLIDDITVEKAGKGSGDAAEARRSPALPSGIAASADAENGIDVSGKVTLSDTAFAGKHSYRAKRTEIGLKQIIDLEPDARCRISARVRSANGKPGYIHLGILPLDEAGTPISAAKTAYRDGTFTEVTEAAKKGDRSITVKDVSRWRKNGAHVVAFAAKEDLCDLPNHRLSGTISAVESGKSGGGVIRFKTPLPFDVPVGTAVRQHASGGRYQYVAVAPVKPGKNWQEIRSQELESRDMRYASSFQVVVVTNAHPTAEKDGDILIDEIKVEKVKDLHRESAAVSGNVLLNPDFGESPVGEFGYWSIGVRDAELHRLPGAGAHGMDAVRVKFHSANDVTHCAVKVLPAGSYLMGGYVRTKDFKAERSGFRLHDSGGYWTLRTGAFPADTGGKWVKVARAVVIPSGVFAKYTKNCMFDIHAEKSSGELEVCSPFLIPLSPEAAAATAVLPPALHTHKRIFPITPVLNRIRAAKPELFLAVYYPLPEQELDRYECEVSVAGESRRIPLDKRQNVSAALPPIKPGKHTITFRLLDRKSGSVIHENSYPCFADIDRAPEKVRKLNNLVSELGSWELENRDYEFEISTDRWVWFGFRNADRNAAAYLDGSDKPVIRFREAEPSETMRYLSAGKHTLKVTGAEPGNRLTIRLVKQLIIFPFNLWEEKFVDPALHRFGKEFFAKHIYKNFNTMHIMAEVEANFPYYRGVVKNLDEIGHERGKRLITSGNTDFGDPDAIDRSVRTEKSIEKYDGRALDEAGSWWAFDRQMAVAEGLWKVVDFEKPVYLWMAKTRGHLFYPMIHRPLLAAASNAAFGQGKMYMETYIINQPDEESLKKYMNLLNDHVMYAEKSIPDAKSRMVFMTSGYLSLGAWDCNVYPAGDIKYATDYFFWKFANDPQLEGIFGLGYYDYRHSDPELIRWTCALVRHYCIEGKKEMLSKQYGFTCAPGHLKNGDFLDGLRHWDASPAEKDSIAHWQKAGFGGNAWQLRQREYGNDGDCAVQFTRSGKAPNKLSQTAVGLIPGRKYSIVFVSADADDVKNRVCQRREFQLNVALDGAKIVPEQSFRYRLPREIPAKPKRCEFVNHKVVFIAEKPEVKITFSDWQDDRTPGAEIGQKRIMNFVSLMPYFDEQP